MLKLNLGCGKDIKKGFVNIDFKEIDGVDIDIVTDLSKNIPINDRDAEFIYCSHVIEHFSWVEGELFIRECYRCLDQGGRLRILWPDYKGIMTAYVNNDHSYFKKTMEYLNNIDAPYYKSMLDDPLKVVKNRQGNLPPEWHYSDNPYDRSRVKERTRKYTHIIECVDWFVHQYGEHIALYDKDSMSSLLLSAGFKEVQLSNFDDRFDEGSPIRRHTSIYIEALK